MLASFSYCKWRTAGCRTGNKAEHVLLDLPQESGPPLPPLALDPLPVPASPSLPLTTTRQCSLEGSNRDVTVESMTVIFWILSQWYAQRDCDNSIMHLVGGTELSKWYQMKVITSRNRMPFTSAIYWSTVVCMYIVSDILIIHVSGLQWMHI